MLNEDLDAHLKHISENKIFWKACIEDPAKHLKLQVPVVERRPYNLQDKSIASGLMKKRKESEVLRFDKSMHLVPNIQEEYPLIEDGEKPIEHLVLIESENFSKSIHQDPENDFLDASPATERRLAPVLPIAARSVPPHIDRSMTPMQSFKLRNGSDPNAAKLRKSSQNEFMRKAASSMSAGSALPVKSHETRSNSVPGLQVSFTEGEKRSIDIGKWKDLEPSLIPAKEKSNVLLSLLKNLKSSMVSLGSHNSGKGNDSKNASAVTLPPASTKEIHIRVDDVSSLPTHGSSFQRKESMLFMTRSRGNSNEPHSSVRKTGLEDLHKIHGTEVGLSFSNLRGDLLKRRNLLIGSRSKNSSQVNTK